MGVEHRHIEVFRAVMRSGSVTGAARLLHTSQPTVSRELARLEQLLGFDLFERIRGRLQATVRAQVLYDEVQRSYHGLERVLATASGLREFTGGQLAIACVPAFAQSLLPQACRHFMAQRADAGVAITPQESPLLEEWLSAQRFDLGLTEQDSAPPGTRIEHLLVADEVCVLPDSHPLCARTVLQPEDFAGQAFVSLSPTDPYRLQLDALFAARGVGRQLALETQSAASVCSLVREGVGVAIVNPLTALEYSRQGVSLRPLAVSIPFRVSLVRPEYRPASPLAEDFAQALRHAAAEFRQNLARALNV